MRNQLVAMMNGLRKSLVLFPKVDLTGAVISQTYYYDLSNTLSVFFCLIMLNFILFFY